MHRLPARSSLLVILVTALAPISWGSTYLVTTELLPPDRPLAAAVIRTLPAGLLLVLLTRCFRPSVTWGRLLTLSVVNIGAFQALLFVAAYRLPGGIAAVVGALQPLIVLAFSAVIDRARPHPFTIITALGGVAGMALLFASPGIALDPVGLLAAFVGTASMAVGTVLSRRWRQDMPLLGYTGWQLGLGGCALLPFALWLEPPLPSLSLSHGLGYAYLGIVGTLLAYSLWFDGIARLRPVAVSALGLLSPITALTLGWAVLGQALGGRDLVGLAVVLASVAALQVRPGPKPGAARAAPPASEADLAVFALKPDAR